MSAPHSRVPRASRKKALRFDASTRACAESTPSQRLTVVQTLVRHSAISSACQFEQPKGTVFSLFKVSSGDWLFFCDVHKVHGRFQTGRWSNLWAKVADGHCFAKDGRDCSISWHHQPEGGFSARNISRSCFEHEQPKRYCYECRALQELYKHRLNIPQNFVDFLQDDLEEYQEEQLWRRLNSKERAERWAEIQANKKAIREKIFVGTEFDEIH